MIFLTHKTTGVKYVFDGPNPTELDPKTVVYTLTSEVGGFLLCGIPQDENRELIIKHSELYPTIDQFTIHTNDTEQTATPVKIYHKNSGTVLQAEDCFLKSREIAELFINSLSEFKHGVSINTKTGNATIEYANHPEPVIPSDFEIR